MEPKKARRIRDRLRMKAKARLIGKLHGAPGNWDKAYDYLALCSCQMCRNPRRSAYNAGEEKLTMQERRNLHEFREVMGKEKWQLVGAPSW